MVTSGAAPLIVCAFRRVRRSTFTDAFQTCDAGRAGVHLPSEAVHRTRPAEVLTWITRERFPCTVARILLLLLGRCFPGRLIDELDVRHERRIALPGTKLHNPTITTLPVCSASCQFGE